MKTGTLVLAFVLTIGLAEGLVAQETIKLGGRRIVGGENCKGAFPSAGIGRTNHSRQSNPYDWANWLASRALLAVLIRQVHFAD